MPLVAVPSVKLGVTVKPVSAAWFNSTVKVIESPSSADASSIVTFAGRSSSSIIPVAVSVARTVADVPETDSRTVNVSSASE